MGLLLVKVDKFALTGVMFEPNHVAFEAVKQSFCERESYLEKRESPKHNLEVLNLVEGASVNWLADNEKSEGVCDEKSEVSFEF